MTLTAGSSHATDASVGKSPTPVRRPHLTPKERAQLGKAARTAAPLAQHASTDCPPADVTSLLQTEDQGRIPELVPLRYERMLASPFSFFRGSAVVMAEELSALPNSGLQAQLCGDAHLSNFGVFATPERRLIFDINDFDETLAGPFEWDVKRLATSVALVARDLGFTSAEASRTVYATVARYRTAMRDFAQMGNLSVWYSNLEIERALTDLAPRVKPKDLRRTTKAVARARTRDSTDAMRKLTETVDGETRFVNQPPLIVPVDRLLTDADATAVRDALLEILDTYRSTLPQDRRLLLDQFQVVDVARKVVGVGSVGTAAYVLLLTGRDATDPLVLQAKEAGASVLEGRCGVSTYDNAGQRVVNGQRLIQAASDIFLGWERRRGTDGVVRDFYLRQLRDGKTSADVLAMSPRRLRIYGEWCAWTLARGHARSGDRIAIAAYLGKRETFEKAVTEFAEGYAARTERQYQQVQAAVARGAVVNARSSPPTTPATHPRPREEPH